MILRSAAALVLLVSLAGCGQASKDTGRTVADPDGKTYVVTGVTDNGTPRALVKNTEIRLRFADHRLTLTAGCNTMSGRYTLDGSLLTVTAMSMTEMGCAKPLMDQDTWLAGLFAGPVQFTDGDTGAVISGRTVLAIAARTSISPDVQLVGTKWRLVTVYAGQTASSVPPTDVAWVVFDDHGGVRVNDGLNDGSGTARVSGNRITFGDLSWTAVGCTGGPGCPVGNFSRVFSGTTTFEITEQHLTLTHGADGLGFRAVDRLPGGH